MENSQAGTSQPKLPKRNFFLIIQKNLSAIGIGPRSSMPLSAFNRKILGGLVVLGLCTFATLMHIFHDAKNFLDLSESIYECSAFILVTFNLMILVFNSNVIYELIDDIECLANSRK